MTHATKRDWQIAKVQTTHDKAELQYDKAMENYDYATADYYLEIMEKCNYELMELQITHNGNFVNN